MQSCEACGNSYDKMFEISIGGTTHWSDSFACAIHVLAPRCVACKTPIIGHGTEAHGQYFCCAHCARRSGVTEVKDRGSDNPQPGP